MARVFICILIFGFIEFSTSVTCSIMDVENEMDCLAKSLPSQLMSLLIPISVSASMVQILYLLSTDFIPSLVFIFLYLDRIQTPVLESIDKMNAEATEKYHSRKFDED